MGDNSARARVAPTNLLTQGTCLGTLVELQHLQDVVLRLRVLNNIALTYSKPSCPVSQLDPTRLFFCNCPDIAIRIFDTYPLSRDPAAYRTWQASYVVAFPLVSDPTPGHSVSCTRVVPFPCESNQYNHSKTFTSVTLFQPLSPKEIFWTNISNASATLHFRCWPLLPANASNTSRFRNSSFLKSMVTGPASELHRMGDPLRSGQPQ